MINLHENMGPGSDRFALPLRFSFLNLLGPMEFSIKLHTVKSKWSIVYNEGPQVIKKILYFFI